MKKALFLLSMIYLKGFLYSQNEFVIIKETKTKYSNLVEVKVISNLQYDGNSYHFLSTKMPISFNSFAIGWKSSNEDIFAGDFIVRYRVHKPQKGWSEIKQAEGYISPSENIRGVYWTDLLFGFDEYYHDSLEFWIHPPQNVLVEELFLVLQDMLPQAEDDSEGEPQNLINPKTCPEFPAIIPRSEWCGNYTECHNPTYTPTNISPTHVVVHHGASPDTYTDGYAVVRSYWNYHVNTLGWSDIGYNYLFDKYGNFFQGRHNPNLPNIDVRGAHAGQANSSTIGVNFLGNSDVTLPTAPQLNKLCQFLAWWFDHKGFDPLSSAGVTNQQGNWVILPRICGHRDIHPGGTACPGNALYNELPSIRTNTQAIIESCNNPPALPQNLQVSVTSMCSSISEVLIHFTWTNSGSGWYIAVSKNSNFNPTYWKWVSNLTSYTGPAGFVLQSDNTTPWQLEENTLYYWRIWNGSTFTNGPNFSTPSCDSIPPTTIVTLDSNWHSTDFIVNFIDQDNDEGSGIARRFYQVLEFDGSKWGANATRGFFADNFDDLDTNIWKIGAGGGTWTVQNGHLIQSDGSINNTNLYAYLNQTLSNRYLYQFSAKVESVGHQNGTRFGFHFFSDNGSLLNRGNSYFIWFRIETSKLEFYKVINDVFQQVKVISNITTNLNTWYDIKVIYDRITGEILVYRDNKFLGSWTDPSPYSTNGNYISFRTGNSILTVSDLKVYRTRFPSVIVSVGNEPSKDIRYQNLNPQTPAAKIKSIVNDSVGNLSTIAHKFVNIDWTPPNDIAYVNDGIADDIDIHDNLTTLSANWCSSFDTNSSIAYYEYAVGTSPGETDVVAWTNNNLDTMVTLNNLNLIDGQTYYFSVRAINNAGLPSNLTSSDGQKVSIVSSEDISHTETSLTIFPNPSTNKLINIHLPEEKSIVEISIYDIEGKLLWNQKFHQQSNNIVIPLQKLNISEGLYFVKLLTPSAVLNKKIIIF